MKFQPHRGANMWQLCHLLISSGVVIAWTSKRRSYRIVGLRTIGLVSGEDIALGVGVVLVPWRLRAPDVEGRDGRGFGEAVVVSMYASHKPWAIRDHMLCSKGKRPFEWKEYSMFSEQEHSGYRIGRIYGSYYLCGGWWRTNVILALQKQLKPRWNNLRICYNAIKPVFFLFKLPTQFWKNRLFVSRDKATDLPVLIFRWLKRSKQIMKYDLNLSIQEQIIWLSANLSCAVQCFSPED